LTKKFQNILFDIGGVLYHFNPKPLLDYLITNNIIENNNFELEFINSNFQCPQEIGLCNMRQSFYSFNNKLSTNVLDDINNLWLETITPSLPMVNLIEELVDNGYNVALLSNIGPDHAAYIIKQCKVFEKCIKHFSCDVGARKPSKLFFQSFCLQHETCGNSIYFDDRKENISIGKRYFESVVFNLNNYSSDEEAAKNIRSYIF